MASCYFLLKQFEDVLIYFNSIKSYFYNDDAFNFNYAQAKAAVGNYKEAEEVNFWRIKLSFIFVERFPVKISKKKYEFKRVLIWNFISGEMKYFHIGVWSTSYNCLHETPLNETRCGCYFIVVILTELNFHFG